MDQLLNKYCSDEVSKHGLFLLDLPTGFGKTYHILNYIFENLEHLGKKKIFFITSLKKNLPIESLRTRCYDNGKGEIFDKSVLFIDSNQELVINNLLIVESDIPDYFKKNSSFQNLRSEVKYLQDYKNSRTGKIKSFELKMIEQSEKNIREKLEPKFRRFVSEMLSKDFPKKRDRKKAVKKNSDFQWIGKLYPPVFTDERKVYFLSIDKFFAKNTTIIEPSYFFHEHEITKDALIFIDEFDSTKERILNRIIENGLDKKTDFIHLFNEIHTCLETNRFPFSLLEPSRENLEWDRKNEEEGLPPVQMPEDIVEQFKAKANEISERFRLPYSYKTVDAENNTRNLLFHDFTYHTVLQDEKRFVAIRYNSNERFNAIHFVNEKPKLDEQSVLWLLNQIRGFLNYFQNGVRLIASNYVQRRKGEDQRRNEDYTFEAALHTVLDEFRLERRHRDFIIDNIVTESKIQQDTDRDLSVNLTVYDQGFRYYDFVDSDEHATQSKIFIYSFQNTPEKFLLKLCKKSKVIGVSATAKIDCVTGNYDLQYLKQQLGERYLTSNKEELTYLQKIYDNATLGYDQLKIHINYLSNAKKLTDAAFEELFENKEIASDVLNRLRSTLDKDYNINRYLKIARCYKAFLLKDDIKAFLCLLNKMPKPNDYQLDLNILEIIFKYLIATTKYDKINPEEPDSVKRTYDLLYGVDFDNQKKELIANLDTGKKIFIISTYQTMGAGQNLQFHPMDDQGLIRINDFNQRELETDINGLYLDKPSHLLVNISPDLDEESFVKYLFQLEFLQDHGDISARKLKNEVKYAFQNLQANPYSGNKPERPEDFEKGMYNKRNYANHLAKVIIQAVGRICRTNLKEPNIFIYADEDIYPFIKGINSEEMLVLHEFQAMLLNPPISPVEKNFESEKLERLVNLGNLFARKTNSKIKAILSKDYWNQESITTWKFFREQALKHPFIEIEEVQRFHRELKLYTQLPTLSDQYSYTEKQDFDTIHVNFNGEGKNWVSAKAARLSSLLRIPGLEAHFGSMGWKKSFEQSFYLLNPPMFRNIYLGALGEEIGKFIFNEYLNIPLLDMPDQYFELFDFCIEEGIYVDFKHWRESTVFDASGELEKINGKLNKIGGKKVFIINILAESDYQVTSSSDGRVVEIPYLFSITQNKVNEEALIHLKSEIV